MIDYDQILKQHGSFRKAAASLKLTKTKFVRLWKIQLGLCQRRTSCKNQPMAGKTLCKECSLKMVKNSKKPYRIENTKSYNEQYRIKNIDKFAIKSKQYYWDNHKTQRQYRNKWSKENPHYGREKAAFRRSKYKQATMSWVDRSVLRHIYSNTPENHHVDHIIPIIHENICGLHVPWNLQYLHKTHNDNKSNSFDYTSENKSWKLNRTLIRSHTIDELWMEFKDIYSAKGDYAKAPNKNKITTHFNPHFYEVERDLWLDPSIRDRIFANREKYLHKHRLELTDLELLRAFKISGIHIGFSHHSPLWIKQFIEDYNIKSLYDPCGGWGHRLLGSADIKYIYNDIDERSCAGARDMINFFNLTNKTVYNHDSANFTPDEDYECVFTCPPYFNIEIYKNEIFLNVIRKGYREWLKEFWRKTIRCSLKPSVKYFCFIINHRCRDDMVKVCAEENLSFHAEYLIGAKQSKGHLQKAYKKSESLLVFKPHIK